MPKNRSSTNNINLSQQIDESKEENISNKKKSFCLILIIIVLSIAIFMFIITAIYLELFPFYKYESHKNQQESLKREGFLDKVKTLNF